MIGIYVIVPNRMWTRLATKSSAESEKDSGFPMSKKVTWLSSTDFAYLLVNDHES